MGLAGLPNTSFYVIKIEEIRTNFVPRTFLIKKQHACNHSMRQSVRPIYEATLSFKHPSFILAPILHLHLCGR